MSLGRLNIKKEEVSPGTFKSIVRIYILKSHLKGENYE